MQAGSKVENGFELSVLNILLNIVKDKLYTINRSESLFYILGGTYFNNLFSILPKN